jgi:Ser/Thr protein kinase RdoA (MazF antagonist)
VIDLLEKVVGSPVELEELKCKPGRRTTLRARGPVRSAIVKRYESRRAPLVAARVNALANGPPEPLVPEVLLSDATLRVVVLSDLPGTPLREAVLAHDLDLCRHVGATLGRWHRAWTGHQPAALRPHTGEREREIVLARAADSASRVVARRAHSALAGLNFRWTCTTVVHRDLYEEQILLGESVSLIDLDDAAAGPPELDLGNLWAHLQLLGLRARRNLDVPVQELLAGYAEGGPVLELSLLDTFRRLTLVRLACLNDDPDLLELAQLAAPMRGAWR